MTVTSGTKITAAEYNALAIAVNKVFCDNYATTIPSSSSVNRAYGWGQEPVAVTNLSAGDLASGEKITAADWNELIDRIKLGATHVGLSSALTRVSAGDRITANLQNTLETTLANIESIKNTAPSGQITTTVLTPTSHSSGFTTSLVFRSTISFDSYKKARYFFNSGSSIRFALAKSGGGAEDSAWQLVYDSLSAMTLSLGDFTAGGSATVQGKGFEDLTFVDQNLASIISGAKTINVTGKITNSSDTMVSDSAQAVKIIITFSISQSTATASTGTHTLTASSNKAANISAASGSVISFAIVGPTYTAAVQSYNNSVSPSPSPTPGPTPAPTFSVPTLEIVNPSDATLSFVMPAATWSSTKTVTLRNVGSSTLTISNIAISENNVTAQGEWGWVTSPTFPKSVAPGDTASFTIRYQGPSEGNFTNSITISSNDPTGSKTIFVYQTITASTFGIAPNTTSVNEGDTITWTATTSGVADGTVLYWSIGGDGINNPVSYDDFVPPFPLSAIAGSVTITGNTGTISLTLATDTGYDGDPESMILRLHSGSSSGPVLATSATVYVNDTATASPTPAPTAPSSPTPAPTTGPGPGLPPGPGETEEP